MGNTERGTRPLERIEARVQEQGPGIIGSGGALGADSVTGPSFSPSGEDVVR